MKVNAIILNSSDQTKNFLYGMGYGSVDTHSNMMSEDTPMGSQFLDLLNKGFFIKTSNEGKVSDWTQLAGEKATKCNVAVPNINEMALGTIASNLQENIVVTPADEIIGTLKYVENFTGYSNIKEEQNGHYLFLMVPLSKDAEERKKQSVVIQLGEGEEKTLTIKGDMTSFIARIKEGDETLKITLKISEGEPLERTFNLSKLKKLVKL